MADKELDGSKVSRGRAAGWVLITGGGQAARAVISIASAAILGRLLTPVDFGLVATVAPIIAFTQLLQNLGLTQALVQHPNLQRGHINALFLVTVGVGSLLALSLLGLSPFIASFFGEPKLKEIVWGLALCSLLAAMASTPLGLLNRKLKFVQLAIIDVVAALFGLAVGIAFAYKTGSYWSLVLMQGAMILLQLLLAGVLSGWTPGRATFDGDVRKMLGFGAGFSVFDVLNFFSRNADALLVARFYGPHALGLYDRAYKLMLTPLQQAMNPFSRVMQPLLARLQDNPQLYRQRYFEAVTTLCAVIHPGIVAAIVFHEAAIQVVLGDRWSEAAPIFFWLAILGLAQPYAWPTGWLFVSQGRGREYAIVGVVTSIIAMASFVVGLQWGPVGVAMSYTIAEYGIRLPFGFWMAGRRGPVSFPDMVLAFIPHACAIAASAGALFILRQLWNHQEPQIVGLAGMALCAYAVYVPVLVLFPEKRRLAKEAVDAGMRRLRVLRARPTT